jgi:hypothetical protein
MGSRHWQDSTNSACRCCDPCSQRCAACREPTTRTLPVEVAGTHWRASINPLLLEGVPPLYLVTAIPEHELMADAYRLIQHSAVATLLVLLFTIPLTWGLARSISRSLGSLASQAEAIRHFDFAQPIADPFVDPRGERTRADDGRDEADDPPLSRH